MKIKICKENQSIIEAELLKVNGKSSAHCYTVFREIEEISEKAERLLSKLFPKTFFKGAQFWETSGVACANSYKGIRNVTSIRIERGSKEWFLISISKATLWPNQSGGERLLISESQKTEAINRFCERFGTL